VRERSRPADRQASGQTIITEVSLVTTRSHRLAALALAVVLCAGCAADSGASDPASSLPGAAGLPRLVIADGPITEPGMSVADALGHQATDDLVTVTGALFVDPDGTVRLCDAIAESFPPQCGGDRIVVEGLDPAAVAGLQTEGDVSWAEGVTLFGSVE
jgi:hypothetical protein